ncbi:MAG: CinA family protein [Candidatus Omnitrophica bacterium]|nr:CinA family protein [Candidatus Omnitrophota bacterium]
MELIARKIHTSLIKEGKTLAVAESCTGGSLSQLLTTYSGSSSYFLLGVVAYSNKAKEKILKIPAQIIIKNGAVSQAVAKRMARAVRKISGADFGIGITGIAGPTGATTDKPLGTVFIAVQTKNKILCRRFNFKGNRSLVRKKSCQEALRLLKIFL